MLRNILSVLLMVIALLTAGVTMVVSKEPRWSLPHSHTFDNGE